jgi:hypothetical protein
LSTILKVKINKWEKKNKEKRSVAVLVLVDEVLSVLEISEGFPSSIVKWIAFPQNEVLNLTVKAALVEYSFNFILWLLRVLDLNRWR